MAVSRAIRRLLHIRNLREEQGRIDLESALGELHVLEQALEASQNRQRLGRYLVGHSAHTGEAADRSSALEESSAAARHRAGLEPRIADSREEVNELRREFLLRRMERQQAETLIEQAEARDAIETNRRTQQALDGLHLLRRHREDGARNATAQVSADPSTSQQKP